MKFLLRRKAFAPDTVNEVFRYGAVVGSVIEQHRPDFQGSRNRPGNSSLAAEEKNESFHMRYCYPG